MTQTKQEKEMKKQFDKFIANLPERVGETPKEVLWEFISKALQTQREEMIKIVEGKKKERKEILSEEFYQKPHGEKYTEAKKLENYLNEGYNQALNDILTSLKEL